MAVTANTTLMFSDLRYAIAHGQWRHTLAGAPNNTLSRLTGYPSWSLPIEDNDWNVRDAVTVFSVVVCLISAYVAVKVCKRQGKIAKNPLNCAVAVYMIATAVATLGFEVLDLGKVWTPFGMSHNTAEIAILLILVCEGHKEGYQYLGTFLVAQYLICTLVVFLLPWPLDALFFKWQGLATDIALVINYTRLYMHNLPEKEKKHKKQKQPIALEEDDETGVNGHVSISADEPGMNASNSNDTLIAVDEHGMNGYTNTESLKRSAGSQEVCSSITLLITAAALHTFGNCVQSTFNTLFSFFVFQFLYTVFPPFYVFFICHKVDCKGMISLPTTWIKETFVGIGCMILSMLVVALGSQHQLSS
ncbi:hypothetical protein BZG36_00609 [Bifiguratus adelaidae]|uniref:Uncharacterized protein n=1 Tax=Bifiguratus adelaidae TaxID=1938954 RepID=A0A261Y7I3_9FUNG|nr:hypothetical protein BZG36_00609 [Bifiguratus adelaidae]